MLRIELAPGILEGDGAVLELLAYDLDVLVVLFAVSPVLLVLHTVASCALQLLHILTVDGVLELDGEVAGICGGEHPAEQLGVAVVHSLHTDVDATATGNT